MKTAMLLFALFGGGSFAFFGEDDKKESLLESKQYQASKNFSNYDWKTKNGLGLATASFSKNKIFFTGTLAYQFLRTPFIPYAIFSVYGEKDYQIVLGGEYFVSNFLKTYIQLTHLHGYEVISTGFVLRKKIKSFSFSAGLDGSYIPKITEESEKKWQADLSPYLLISHDFSFKKFQDILRSYVAIYPLAKNFQVGIKARF